MGPWTVRCMSCGRMVFWSRRAPELCSAVSDWQSEMKCRLPWLHADVNTFQQSTQAHTLIYPTGEQREAQIDTPRWIQRWQLFYSQTGEPMGLNAWDGDGQISEAGASSVC